MAINLPLLHDLTLPRQARSRLETSLNKDPERGGTWCGLRPAAALRKRIRLEPGETHRMASISGAGVITRLWMTTFMPLNRHALADLVLRFYWDGETQPSVACPFGEFFGAGFGRSVEYIAEPVSITSGGFNCLWPMPFASQARLDLTNEGHSPVDPFFYQVGYYELDAPPQGDLRFHARWGRQNPTRYGAPFTILETQGNGHYVGCQLFLQNLEWWLRPPLSKIVLPYGFGLGMLEGWESIYVDGEETPSIVGTGTEDYFGGSFYFYRGAPFSAPYHGCTVRDFLRGQIAAYRFDVQAPVPFRQALRVTIDHGLENQVRGDYASVAYWYQDEPHPPYPDIPGIAQRRPASPLIHAAQMALVAGAPALAGLALARRLRKREF